MIKPIIPLNVSNTLDMKTNPYYNNKYNSYGNSTVNSSTVNSSTVNSSMANSSISKLSIEMGHTTRNKTKEKSKKKDRDHSKSSTAYSDKYSTTSAIALKKKNEFMHRYNKPNKSTPNMTLDYFHLVCTVGKGSFGRVILSMLKTNNKYFAVKVLDKRRLVRDKQIKHVLNERNILNASDHPNIVKLHFSFKDNSFLYLALDIAYNGDLYTLIRTVNHFDENLSTFYSANIFLALEYLHKNNVVYRDLKPENILLQPNGYLKLTDFGFAKLLKDGRTNTMCGTPDYISPEVIRRHHYGKSVDWWAFGVFIYELNKGKPPFQGKSHTSIYEKIKKCDYKMPSTFGGSLTDICAKLLVVDVTKRLGCLKNESDDIRDHRWFNKVDWLKMYAQKYTAPFIPKLKGPAELAYEKSKYPEEKIEISTYEEYRNEFDDF